MFRCSLTHECINGLRNLNEFSIIRAYSPDFVALLPYRTYDEIYVTVHVSDILGLMESKSEILFLIFLQFLLCY